MKKKITITLSTLAVLGAIALSVLYISTHNIPVLNPKGIIGEKERDLIVLASILMLIVLIPVYVLAFVIAWKYKADNKKAKYTPDWEHSTIGEIIWWGVPFLIISVLAVFTWTSSHDLDPSKPLISQKEPITIQVVALEWKWLFIYPDYGIASVNFFQFPENTPLNFEITADAPMNSFWIPQLGGQIYAMPAMRSKLHLMANEIGDYRGSSSNLSGKGFAGMIFRARASSEEDFEHWVQSVKQSQTGLEMNEYNRLIEPSEYNPVSYYSLKEPDLFELILQKYRAPSN